MKAEQLSLDGFVSARGRTIAWGARNPVFFALVPPPAARAEILNLARDFAAELGVRPQLNPHLSLIGLGDLEDMPAEELEAAAAAVRALRFDAFEVTFDRAQSFGRGAKPPLVLRPHEGEARVVMLGQTLRRALIAAGLLDAGKWTFTPHLTLLRGPTIEERPMAPIGWTVREIALIHSERTLGRHNVLGRFPAR
jgi:2'-5' RNA ligase